MYRGSRQTKCIGKKIREVQCRFYFSHICKRFITKYGLNTIVCPNQKTYAKQLELIYYPTNIVLDKDGFVYKTFSGSTDYIEKVISVELDFLLRM